MVKNVLECLSFLNRHYWSIYRSNLLPSFQLYLHQVPLSAWKIAKIRPKVALAEINLNFLRSFLSFHKELSYKYQYLFQYPWNRLISFVWLMGYFKRKFGSLSRSDFINSRRLKDFSSFFILANSSSSLCRFFQVKRGASSRW